MSFGNLPHPILKVYKGFLMLKHKVDLSVNLLATMYEFHKVPPNGKGRGQRPESPIILICYTLKQSRENFKSNV